jgi:drug/metabolite transporter (DMT)-like permease
MFSEFVVGFLLAVGSSLCWTSFDVTRKHVGQAMSATAVVAGVMLFHAPVIAPFVAAAEAGIQPSGELTKILFVEVPSMGWTYAGLASMSVLMNIAANFLFLRAVQISPLGLTTPYLAFTPIFSTLPALIVYGEEPTGWGIAGIVTVCLGAFFLNPGSDQDGWMAPIKALWTERGSIYMLIVAGLWSITPVIDKRAGQLTAPLWHTLILGLGLAAAFIGYRLVRDRGGGELWEEVSRDPFWLFASAVFAVGAMSLQLGSYEFIEIAYVETIKRAIGVTGGVLAGYVFFDEEDLGQRLVASAIMSVGVGMVLLGG